MTALQRFFESFPEFLKNELYTSGNSYGGIHAPYLAWRIHEWNQKADLYASVDPNVTKYNLKGFIASDSAIDWTIDGMPHTFDYLFNFNLIPYELYNDYKTQGCVIYFRDLFGNNTDSCMDLWVKMIGLVWTATSGLNDPFSNLLRNIPKYTDPLL